MCSRRQCLNLRIDILQESISKDIKGQVTTRLNSTVRHVALEPTCEREVLLLDRDRSVSNHEGDGREVRLGGVGREHPTLLAGVLLGTGDCRVDGLTHFVGGEEKSGTGVGDGLVARKLDGSAIDLCGGRVEHPKALRIVDRGVGNLRTRWDNGLIDLAKGICFR